MLESGGGHFIPDLVVSSNLNRVVSLAGICALRKFLNISRIFLQEKVIL